MAAALFAFPALGQGWSRAEPFLVQSICADPSVLPFEAGCVNPRPAPSAPTLPWRKFDLAGEQASDALLLGPGQATHTFDFGDAPRRFGQRDAGRGDGGNLIASRAADILVAMTEDGGAGIQWFHGPECAGSQEATPGGWLLFRLPAGPEWAEATTRLQRTGAPDRCPARYVASFTRWRRAMVEYPWMDDTAPRPPFRADSMISEHFGGRDMMTSDHLERFWFAQGLGMVRWERWEAPNAVSPAPSRPGAAEQCPLVTGGDAPGPGWVLTDCRMWTRFRRGEQQAMPWP